MAQEALLANIASTFAPPMLRFHHSAAFPNSAQVQQSTLQGFSALHFSRLATCPPHGSCIGLRPSQQRCFLLASTPRLFRSKHLPRVEAEASEEAEAAALAEDEQPSVAAGEVALRNMRAESEFRLSSTAISVFPFLLAASMAGENDGVGYSQASYYTSLGLFIISIPGLYSLIKRSAKSKIVRKTFEIEGPAVPGAKTLTQVAGEITAYFLRNNFTVTKRGETVSFEGIITPNRGQAAFLVFCTTLSLASLALVLTITAPFLGDGWYWITAFSPLSGAYYWTRASRKEEVQVKMVVADDERIADIVIQGDDEEVDRLRRELNLMEKGMVYVKGVFEM